MKFKILKTKKDYLTALLVPSFLGRLTGIFIESFLGFGISKLNLPSSHRAGQRHSTAQRGMKHLGGLVKWEGSAA